MSDVSVRKIEVNLTINGEPRHPSRIVLVSNIQGVPQLQIVHHRNTDGNKRAIPVSAPEIASEMAERQNLIFNDRTSPEVSLFITDGKGGSLNFNGYLTDPIYDMSQTQSNLRDIVRPDYALIESIDYSAYALPLDITDLIPSDLLKDNGYNVPATFDALAKWLLETWDENKDQRKILPSLQVEAEETQNKVNQRCIKYFKELMRASSESFGWTKQLQQTFTDNKPESRNFTIRLMTYLRNSSGSFLSSLIKMAEEFQCFYSPEWDKIGRLANWATVYDNPKECELPIVELNIEAGTKSLFPTFAIAVSNDALTGELDSTGASHNFILYPDEVKNGGSIIRDGGPPWMPGDMVADAVDQAANAHKNGIKSLKKAKKIHEKRTDYHKDWLDAKCDILYEWARIVYLKQSLGASRLDAVIPLDLSLKVGQRYIIKNTNGGSLGTGFLAQIIHDVNIEQSAASCTSRVHFTHIELPGFSLPNK